MPELVGPIQSMEGKRAPGISKIVAARGVIVERAPPYQPDVHPAEYIWSAIKGGYGTRRGDVGGVEYVRRFCVGVSELALSNIAGRCDKVAASMAEEEAALFLDDNQPPGAGSGESDSRDDGAKPAIQLLLLRKAVSPTPARLRTQPAKAYSGNGGLCRFSFY